MARKPKRSHRAYNEVRLENCTLPPTPPPPAPRDVMNDRPLSSLKTKLSRVCIFEVSPTSNFTSWFSPYFAEKPEQLSNDQKLLFAIHLSVCISPFVSRFML